MKGIVKIIITRSAWICHSRSGFLNDRIRQIGTFLSSSKGSIHDSPSFQLTAEMENLFVSYLSRRNLVRLSNEGTTSFAIKHGLQNKRNMWNSVQQTSVFLRSRDPDAIFSLNTSKFQLVDSSLQKSSRETTRFKKSVTPTDQSGTIDVAKPQVIDTEGYSDQTLWLHNRRLLTHGQQRKQ